MNPFHPHSTVHFTGEETEAGREVNNCCRPQSYRVLPQPDAKLRKSSFWACAQGWHAAASPPLRLHGFLYCLVLQKLLVHKRDLRQRMLCVLPRVFTELFTKDKYPEPLALDSGSHSSAEADINMLCRRAEPRFRLPQSSQTSREISLFIMRHWFPYVQTTNHHLLPSETTQRGDRNFWD